MKHRFDLKCEECGSYNIKIPIHRDLYIGEKEFVRNIAIYCCNCGSYYETMALDKLFKIRIKSKYINNTRMEHFLCKRKSLILAAEAECFGMIKKIQMFCSAIKEN